METIIAGGRDFSNYLYLNESCKLFLPRITKIISGTAKGADQLGEKFAQENSIEILYFKPDWNRFGKSAGFKRNEEMAKNADMLIAFWDGKSRGTDHMIKCAIKLGLEVHIFYY